MNKIRTLIVDDEIHARRGLRMLLADEHDVEIVGEAADGKQAEGMIRKVHPDLVFLDVEMPRRNGFELIESIGADAMPQVVFVTAYDQYAVAAFEASAVDYLLKPFTNERFTVAMQRARDAVRFEGTTTLGTQLRELIGSVAGQAGTLERFTVKSGGVMQVHKVGEIDWIEADEYYVKLHIGKDVYMVRQTMSALEEQLPGDRFARIHRSTIVNLDRIAALEPLFQGDYTIMLQDGTRLRMSRRRSNVLAGLVKNLN